MYVYVCVYIYIYIICCVGMWWTECVLKRRKESVRLVCVWICRAVSVWVEERFLWRFVCVFSVDSRGLWGRRRVCWIWGECFSVLCMCVSRQWRRKENGIIFVCFRVWQWVMGSYGVKWKEKEEEKCCVCVSVSENSGYVCVCVCVCV